ncbi:hypothetical protein B9Q04_19430 [Candidatus Marsarchaeota G2 archaeon BE_D]|uniref:Uncharacterized protein n=1 Tax=Candidatus Marsarchaeota G2 archaeon BE_D TaxID=1978158 RepID=A0A2R6C0N3_9ARCH|nr:MAG: hypothetical protein B9Q04_19430 [Candidatus Marsarchaeota G2 archaeon BE_D]
MNELEFETFVVLDKELLRVSNWLTRDIFQTTDGLLEILRYSNDPVPGAPRTKWMNLVQT